MTKHVGGTNGNGVIEDSNMTDVTGVEVGQRVKFTGFTSDPDEMADNGELLKKNQTYELVALNDDGGEEGDVLYVMQGATPNYEYWR